MSVTDCRALMTYLGKMYVWLTKCDSLPDQDRHVAILMGKFQQELLKHITFVMMDSFRDGRHICVFNLGQYLGAVRGLKLP